MQWFCAPEHVFNHSKTYTCRDIKTTVPIIGVNAERLKPLLLFLAPVQNIVSLPQKFEKWAKHSFLKRLFPKKSYHHVLEPKITKKITLKHLISEKTLLILELKIAKTSLRKT